MEPAKFCPSCGRENSQTSKYCKYCGYYINYPEESQKKPNNIIFDYIKENRDYFVVVGVFAALTVYLIQFYNSLKPQNFIINFSSNFTANPLFTNQSLGTGINFNNFSTSANFSYSPVIEENFFGKLLPVLGAPPALSLSLAVIACFSILLLILLKIISDIAELETENYDNLFDYYLNNLSKLIVYFSLSIFALILLCYIVFSNSDAAVAFAIVYILCGSFCMVTLTFKYIKKNSKFIVLDYLIVSLILLVIAIILIQLILYLFTTTPSTNTLIIIIILGCMWLGSIYGIIRGVIPLIILIIKRLL